ncbi:MAG: chloride channel protein [Cellvibrionaceae bacterium]
MPDKNESFLQTLHQATQKRVDDFRHSLAYIDALPQLTLLGFISGVAAALLIVAFRILIDTPLHFLLPDGNDNFESLPIAWHFFLPFLGAITIGIIFHFLKPQDRSVSVSHVLDRLHHHQGQMPLRNVIVQFFGGAASLITGQSVGREGPAVHLGAGAASLLGQWLQLPNNSLRILVGCGVAAAISASFNTPIAGVIFAMEVVLMEYTITGFIPIILASASGAVISQLAFGTSSSLSVSAIEMKSLWELPYMALAGLVIAVFAAAFLQLQLIVSRGRSLPIIFRFTLIGLVTGLLALFAPQILGLGYDSLNSAMLGEMSLRILVVIVIAKLTATAVSTGLGIPGGLIGPCLVIGGCLGGILGIIGNHLNPDQASNAGFYVTIGMAAMMGAVLNAPLAALMAVLELTYNPNIIFPSMMVIVVACVITQQVFKCESIFVAQMRTAGTPLKSEPDRQVLSRVGVWSVMSTDFVMSKATISADEGKELLSKRPQWIVIEEEDADVFLLRAADLSQFLETPSQDILKKSEDENISFSLKEIPGQRYKMHPLHQRANLFEVRQKLKQVNGEVVYIERQNTNRRSSVLGVITNDMIENYYSR